ncbi:MAG: 2OG-Fe(II) oxygenase, partial [Gammaproteobacteria bacterium]|nr:2OG-Fe(II) oxygenase [Gammaproteobacteria bacterium]
EAHYALYPPGTFYKRHVDNFRGRSSRVVTSLLYLNPHWQPGDGGEMQLYPDAADAAQRVEPRLGTFVLFMAEDLPHEVLPTRVPRGSIAGWFRRDLR